MSTLDALADRVSAGEALTEQDAASVLGSHDLIAIGMMADTVRRRLHGPRTTFVRVFEMHVDAPLASLPANVKAGEFRIVGRPSSLDAALAAASAARALADGVPVSGYSIGDLIGLGDPETVFRSLRAAGLDAVAEVPVDAPAGAADAVGAARNEGLHVDRLTVTSAVPESALDVIIHARRMQAEAGGFRVFAPLPRTMSVSTPSTGYDDVKLAALARLVAMDIPSIQVDWVLYGPKLAQVALTVGADDVDRVAAHDPGTLGARRSVLEEIRGNIRAASLEPVERNARFEVVG